MLVDTESIISQQPRRATRLSPFILRAIMKSTKILQASAAHQDEAQVDEIGAVQIEQENEAEEEAQP